MTEISEILSPVNVVERARRTIRRITDPIAKEARIEDATEETNRAWIDVYRKSTKVTNDYKRLMGNRMQISDDAGHVLRYALIEQLLERITNRPDIQPDLIRRQILASGSCLKIT